jgi:bifunctional DNA-binding transcriptional regulator/antitoxin component of YhaV-PrlF toxin-antitoxin module
MTVTLKDKKPIVVPDAVRRKAGLRTGDRIEFRVVGRVINIVPKLPAGEDEYSPKMLAQIIEATKKNPMSRAELRAENARIMAYGARQAKKAGIKERDIPRVIHESRSRRRTP